MPGNTSAPVASSHAFFHSLGRSFCCRRSARFAPHRTLVRLGIKVVRGRITDLRSFCRNGYAAPNAVVLGVELRALALAAVYRCGGADCHCSGIQRATLPLGGQMRPKAYLVVLGVIIAVVTASGAAEGQNQGLDRIIKAGTVRIAVPDNFRPFGDHDTDGKLKGYDID